MWLLESIKIKLFKCKKDHEHTSVKKKNFPQTWFLFVSNSWWYWDVGEVPFRNGAHNRLSQICTSFYAYHFQLNILKGRKKWKIFQVGHKAIEKIGIYLPDFLPLRTFFKTDKASSMWRPCKSSVLEFRMSGLWAEKIFIEALWLDKSIRAVSWWP